MNFYQYLTGGASGESEDAEANELQNLFLSKLTHESNIAGGTFLYDSQGSLQDYLKEVEDSVLLYIFLAKFDVVRTASLFEEQARLLVSDGFGPQLSSLVYATSPINRIRSSIRIFLVNSSGSMFRIIDDILLKAGIDEGHPSPFVKKMMIEKGRSLRPQLKSSLPFTLMPLIDDSLNSVAEMSLSQLQRSTGNDGGSVIAIRVTRCGSAQVNGDYLLRSGSIENQNDEGEISFVNSSGFQLSRMERHLIKTSSTMEDMETPNRSVMFDWHFLNPVLSCSYYLCSTFSRSTLPPLW